MRIRKFSRHTIRFEHQKDGQREKCKNDLDMIYGICNFKKLIVLLAAQVHRVGGVSIIAIEVRMRNTRARERERDT